MGRRTQELVHIIYKLQNQEERAKPKLQANVTCTTVEYVMARMWKKQNTVRTGLAVITVYMVPHALCECST